MLIDRQKTGVYNNMSYMAHIKNEDNKTITDYAAKLLPFEDRKALRARAEQRRTAHFAPYLMCYEYGMRAVEAVLAKPPEAQRVLVPQIYKPHTVQSQDRLIAAS